MTLLFGAINGLRRLKNWEMPTKKETPQTGLGWYSRREARRLIEQGAVKLDGKTIKDVNYIIIPIPGKFQILQVGKRRWVKLVTPEENENNE